LIFVTIGSLFPFDRLVRLIDDLVPAMPEETFFAQIGEGAYQPVNMPFERLLTREAFTQKLEEADVIIAHAGMGSVITAMELGKPIVLIPRILEQGEHTTDHQMATARWLADRPGVHVCMKDAELRAIIVAARSAAGGGGMRKDAPEPFVERIRDFIASA